MRITPRWILPQRRAYNHKKEGAINPKHKLSDEREEKLRSIGFVFVTKERTAYAERVKAGIKAVPRVSWEGRLAEFVRWKERHGHPYVPTVTSGEDKGLGRWVASQRMAYRAYKEEKKVNIRYGILTAEKALALSNAGFAFDASQIRRTPSGRSGRGRGGGRGGCGARCAGGAPGRSGSGRAGR